MRPSTWFLIPVAVLCASTVRAAPETTLELVGRIPLEGVRGRVDHFGIDAERGRLLVAALGNDTIEVVDLKAGRRARSLRGFGEPQGVLYVPRFNRIYVANGSANRVDVLDGASLERIRGIDGLEDADNVRYDSAEQKVYVGYGRGALRILDASTGDSLGDIGLAGHPESFQLERNGTRIFVNVPGALQVAVVDRAKRAVVATWSVPRAAANFPMALDEAGRRLFVGARIPAVLLVYDIDTGKVVARQAIGGDTDDVFFDAQRKRVYVICGEGSIDVVQQLDADRYVLRATLRTARRARTGFWDPDARRLYVAAPAGGTSPAELQIYAEPPTAAASRPARSP